MAERSKGHQLARRAHLRPYLSPGWWLVFKVLVLEHGTGPPNVPYYFLYCHLSLSFGLHERLGVRGFAARI
jgi:hypothetical protein